MFMHNPDLKEIKKIFKDHSFIKEPFSIKKILENININPTESMKHILCRMQNNEDLDFLFNEIIKLIDTREVNLKFYTNLYLKVYTKNNPIRQLLCVNTFLKDLSDKSNEIKKSTLKVIESIKDEVILTNYKNKIKNMKNESKEIKMRMIKFKEEIGRGEVGMCLNGGQGEGRGQEIVDMDIFKDFINSEDPEMRYKGIEILCSKSINMIMEEGSSSLYNSYNNPPSSLINDLINRNLNNPKSLYFLIKMISKQNLELHVNPSPFLHSNYLPLFFYSSFLSKDKQSIYNLSLLFLKSSYEKVYHILLFQESLLDFVDYENSNYLIYEEDPFFIKTQKVKMLFYKLDDISIYELKRQSKGELKGVILENGLKKGFVIEGLFENDEEGSLSIKEGGSKVEGRGVQNQSGSKLGYKNLPSNNPPHNHNPPHIIINTLFYNFPFSSNYTYLIKNYLLNINPLTLTQDSFKKYLYLVGKVCDDYEFLNINEFLNENENINEILKFYISFFKRKILSEEKFIEIIRGLKKNEKFKEKAKVLLNLINLKGPYVLFDFEESGDERGEGKGEGVKLEIYEDRKDFKDKGVNEGSKEKWVKEKEVDNPLLTCKPYNNPTNPTVNPLDSLHSLKESLQIPSHSPSIPPLHSLKKENWSFNNNLLYSPSGDLIIDTILLKGTLFLTKNEIKLEIDILEKPLKIKFGIENLEKEVKVNKESILILKEIHLKDINKKFKILINNNLFEILIEKEKLITPWDCDKNSFEKEFKRIKNYKIIEKLDEKLIKKIDENSFTFKILGKIVYGKGFCDQIVIKGEKEVMEIF